MSTIPAADVEVIWKRAGARCEYCRMHQEEGLVSFHLDHIISKQHEGSDDLDNLCLACSQCNLQKGPNLAGLRSGKLYQLFNPRLQNWQRHFEWNLTTLVGKTATGQVTIQVLDLNSEERIMRRETLLLEGRFPPDET